MSIKVLTGLVGDEVLAGLTGEETDLVTERLLDHIRADSELRARLAAVVEDRATELMAAKA